MAFFSGNSFQETWKMPNKVLSHHLVDYTEEKLPKTFKRNSNSNWKDSIYYFLVSI